MATFISDNQKFHIFSKSPVRANMELFQATNKSGHTVISDEVRTDDIPWFINVPDVNNPPSYVKNPRKNDIIFQGKFNSLSTAAVCKKWDGEKWVDGPNLKENPILKNENDDDVIQVHFENDIEYVSDTNNAGTTSDKQAAFVLKTNGEMLTHFVSPTDKIYNGIPSNGYGLYLFLDSQLQSETDSNDSGYIANSYAGIIQFNKARSESASKFKVITFEYIGGYLNKSLDKIEDDLKDYIDEEIKEHNKEFIAHKNNENAEKHLSQSEVDGLNTLTSANKISGIETATQYDYQAEADLSKALSAEITTPNASDSTFKNVTIKLHLRDKVLQQSTMPVTSKAIYNHVHKQSVNVEKASDNVTVEEVTTNENERRKYTIAVDGYTTSETDNIVDDIHEKIQTTADDINKNVAEHTSNNGIHITDTERVSWNNNEVVLQKHLNDQNSHVSDEDREKWATKDGLSILAENINDINNEIETYNYALAQSIETGTTSGSPNNTRGFGTLITNNITLGKVITYCHSTGGNENSNIWLKVFEKTSAPHVFKGISDTSLNHKHSATLEYTFKNSDIKLEANKEYFFVFCPENQKNSTTFQNASDSVDCCIQTVSNTTGYGGVCGAIGISNDDYIALHKIYKKPGKFAFAADLEEETTRATQREEELENFIKNKVEALPSVYTGNNELYINCYGFEYTDPFENIILDKIEIKFAKNLDPLSEYRAPGAPVISAEEVENDICKIVVAKVKTPSSPTDPEPPASDEIEIATSSYNTNISKDVNLSHFKFGENILLEKGWNYRFYFYDKNNNPFAAPVIANTIPSGGTTLTKKSVANRYLSERYDYWGAHNNISNNIVLNGLGIKLINSVQEHINNDSIHYTIAGSEYIDISTDGSNTISVTNIAESISDNTSDSLVTESSVIKYADDTKDENGEIIEQGLLTKWHIENEYFHMQKSVADSLKSFNLDNYGVGDICKGVIMELPYLSKIKSISLVAVTASEYNQPLPEKAMTWSNYRLQIVDTLSGQVLATSEIGKNANTSANTASKGYPIGLFDFVDSNTDINQIYCDAKREYQILFVNEAGETVNIHLAYANGNGRYATYENYTFGELAPKVILPDGTIKEHPLSFSVALQPAVECKGYACDFAVDAVKSEELTHLSKQIGELKNYIAYMNASINQLKS